MKTNIALPNRRETAVTKRSQSRAASRSATRRSQNAIKKSAVHIFFLAFTNSFFLMQAQQMISCGTDDNPCAAGKCCVTSTKVNACNQTVRIARCKRLAAEFKPCSLNAVVHCPCQNNLVCRPPAIDSLPCCVDGDEASEERLSKKLKRKRKLKAKKKNEQRSSCSPCRVAREPRSDEEQKMVCSRAE